MREKHNTYSLIKNQKHWWGTTRLLLLFLLNINVEIGYTLLLNLISFFFWYGSNDQNRAEKDWLRLWLIYLPSPNRESKLSSITWESAIVSFNFLSESLYPVAPNYWRFWSSWYAKSYWQKNKILSLIL